MQKNDLPYAYINGDGAKFWYAPTLRCIQLGGTNGKDCIGNTFPDQLTAGTTLTHKQRDALINYLTAAVNRLRKLTEEMKTAKNVTDVL